MRVAIVHDYIREFGGAERVLKVLHEIYPKAPIYTAFSAKGSTAEKEFTDAEIHESWLAPLLKIGNLYSPLRFMIPWIWGSFDLSDYDLVIVSASWYITRGFKIGPNTKVVVYCHTPPRWLYGYETSVGFTKYWPVKIYAAIVGHFLRIFDFKTAQPTSLKLRGSRKAKIASGVDLFIANSENVKKRIEKFYRRGSVVIYPPVDTKRIMNYCHAEFSSASKILKQVQDDDRKTEKYFLIVSRLVGAKGIEEAINAFQSKLMVKYKLIIVGEAAGFSNIQSLNTDHRPRNVEFIGRVNDDELYRLYANATGFIALARDEDFGMTVVEAQAAGCPVIAFNGGGFRETVINGVTGILIEDTNEKELLSAVEKFEKIKWNRKEIQKNAQRFSKRRFVNQMNVMVDGI